MVASLGGRVLVLCLLTLWAHSSVVVGTAVLEFCLGLCIHLCLSRPCRTVVCAGAVIVVPGLAWSAVLVPGAVAVRLLLVSSVAPLSLVPPGASFAGLRCR